MRQKMWRCALVVFAIGAVAPATASADRYVYVSNGFPAGSNDVSALHINADGTLTAVSGSPFDTPGQTVTEGLTLTPDARNLYVAHFGTDKVSGFDITSSGGLSAVAGSPFAGGTTPLGVVPDPNGGHVFDWNHGSAIGVLSRAGNGALSQISGSPFTIPATQSNPFAGSVAPDGGHLYVPNENSSETVAGCGGTCEVNRVSSYSVAANGAVSPLQGAGVITGTTNVKAGGPNPFGSGITPNGEFLYVSNPEDGTFGTLSGFAVNADGTLSSQLPGFPMSVSPGNHPLNIAVAPDGQHLYVATRITNTVNAYTINGNGSLTSVPGSPFATGGTNGKALALTPDGKRLYVSNNGSDDVSGFNVAADGSLSLISGSPWPTGGTDPDLESIAITPNQAPIAGFGVHSTPNKKRVKFNGSGSSDTDGGTVATYDWDFGDGFTKQTSDVKTKHRYTNFGLFTATLRVTDDEGCSTARIFTGKATLCNGLSSAETSVNVHVRKLTARYSKSKGRFKGKLKSDRKVCRRDTVKLVRRRHHRNQVLDRDHTSKKGVWRIEMPDAHGKFIALVRQRLAPDGEPCLAARSKKVRVR